MLNRNTFYKTFPTKEQAVKFMEETHGVLQEDCYTVKFEANYSISKALYHVKTDKYRVYIRIKLGGGKLLTHIVSSDYSLEAYEIARRRVKEGWF